MRDYCAYGRLPPDGQLSPTSTNLQCQWQCYANRNVWWTFAARDSFTRWHRLPTVIAICDIDLYSIDSINSWLRSSVNAMVTRSIGSVCLCLRRSRDSIENQLNRQVAIPILNQSLWERYWCVTAEA